MANLFLLAALLQFLPSIIAAASAPASAPTSTLRRPRLQDDFYTAVNFKWLQSAKPPSWPFKEIADRTEKRLRHLVRVTARKVRTNGTVGSRPSREEQLVGNWYLSGLDLHARKREGLRPLDSIFTAIRTTPNRGSLAGALGRKGFDIFFNIVLALDTDIEERLPLVRLDMVPSGDLFLPDLKQDTLLKPCDSTTNSTEYCEIAKTIISNTFVKCGDSEEAAQVNAQHVIRSVVALLPKVPFDQQYLNVTVLDLQESVPGFDFTAYFKALGVQPEVIFVGQRDWFLTFGEWIRTVSDEQLEAFLRWRIITLISPFLEDEIFDGVYASRVAPQASRNNVFQRLNVEPLFGMLLGQLFSRQTLPPKTYELVVKFVEAMRAALKRRIQINPWMQESTRMEALKKVEAFSVNIGAPQMELFKGLTANPKTYTRNALLAKEYKRVLDLALVGTPYIKTKDSVWPYHPQLVNAFYDPTRNSIYIHAGILQPPMFMAGASDEINFGAIGSVIGHEMTHGFDMTGRMYDHLGMKRNWWTEDDDHDFNRISASLISQFDNYNYYGFPVNGTTILSENIADLGLVIAFDAWNASHHSGGLPLSHNTTEKKVRLPWRKYSEPQRFFLSNARVWRAVETPESAAQVVNGTHPPPKFRVNGPASNINVFYQLFNVKMSDKMYKKPSQRVAIW